MKATILNDQGLKRYFIPRYMNTCIGMCVTVRMCVRACVYVRGWGGVTWRGGRERQRGGTEMETPAVIMYIFQSRLPCEITTAVDTK